MYSYQTLLNSHWTAASRIQYPALYVKRVSILSHNHSFSCAAGSTELEESSSRQVSGGSWLLTLISVQGGATYKGPANLRGLWKIKTNLLCRATHLFIAFVFCLSCPVFSSCWNQSANTVNLVYKCVLKCDICRTNKANSLHTSLSEVCQCGQRANPTIRGGEKNRFTKEFRFSFSTIQNRFTNPKNQFLIIYFFKSSGR